MAVLPMKRVTVCALKRDRKQILELLQRLGTVEVQKTKTSAKDVFSFQDRKDEQDTFQRNAALAEQALAVLGRFAPEKKSLLASLDGRKQLSLEEYNTGVTKRDATLSVCRRIMELDKKIASDLAEIPREQAQLTALEPWTGYDLPLNFAGTKNTAVIVGSLPEEIQSAQLQQKLAVLAPKLEKYELQVISTSKAMTCIFILCEKQEERALREVLGQIGFANPPDGDQNPAAEHKACVERLDALHAEIASLEKEICSFADSREDIRFLMDYLLLRAEKYETIGRLAQSRRTFVLQGFTPERDAAELEKKLSAFDAVVEFHDPGAKDDVPVVLKNNALASPVEGVVESYSLPHRGEMDPTSLVALFYYALFGLMFSDAGYGIIMMLACGICLLKFKNMEQGMKKSLQMFFYCGISTTFWGFMFGSFFGDAVHVIATTFFGRPDIAIRPLWFEPMGKPMQMLVFCFAVGIVHLFVGLGAKLYQCIKQKRLADGLFDAVFWYMLVGGGIAYLLSMETATKMMGLTWTLPALAGKICGYLAIAGAVGIILTGGRESKSWGKRILKGLYSVYGVSGYLSDILSYSRLLALGLATSVIANVFNQMGSMVGNSPAGVIVFVLTFVIGHTLNLGINALGAYVHTNRLEYVEFFGKFYEGGGRKFAPFAEHTKYIKVKEEL